MRRRTTSAACVTALLAAVVPLPTGAGAVEHPVGPRLLAPAASVHTKSPMFRWSAVRGATRYDLRLSRSRAMSAPTTMATTAARTRATLARGVWFWEVRAEAHGRTPASRWSAVRRVDVQPVRDVYAPTRPGGVAVGAVGLDSAVVDYDASHDDSGHVRYRILANGHVVLTTARHTDVRVPLRCGTLYTLAARAVDAAGNRSALSPVAHVRTRACLDTTPPDAPTNLTVVSTTASSITLAWDPATDPGHGSVGQYVLSRDGAVVGGSRTTDYTFTGLSPDQSYQLGVRARDGVGNLGDGVTLTVSTALPPQANGHVRAFVIASDTASESDARSHYTELEQIYPTYFEVTSGGALTGSGQPAFTHWMQIRGVRVMPRVHSEDPGLIESVASDASTRDALVADIAGAVQRGGYDGINLDFEMTMPTTGVGSLTKQQRLDRLRSGFTAFVTELAAALHDEGALLSVDVAANWCQHTDRMSRQPVYCSSSSDSSATTRPRPYLYDYKALAAVADELWLLSWGLHWATSDPGPVADNRWLTAVSAYFTDLFSGRPELERKLTIGIQLYGFDWSYVVVRTDTITMPGAIPTAPQCSSGSATTARPRYSYVGDQTSGTLTIKWLCNTRIATPYEYEAVQQQIAELDVVPTWDAAAGEWTYSAPDPGAAGATREGWFADRDTVASRVQIATSAGWNAGLWRLGREDARIWDDGLLP